MSRRAHPLDSPHRRSQQSPYRDTPSTPRRSNLRDVESAGTYNDSPPPARSKRPKQQAFMEQAPSPTSPRRNVASPTHNRGNSNDLGRKKSLVRHDRARMDRDHPNYHYTQHARRMAVHPSTTGNDPILENAATADEAELEDWRYLDNDDDDDDTTDAKKGGVRAAVREGDADMVTDVGGPKRLKRKNTRDVTTLEEKKALRKALRNQDEALKPPSLWNVYCALITFWAPGAVLRCFGKPQRAQQRAWREKIGIISIILLICAFVGFLTFGFTQAVCGTPTQSFRVNRVGDDSMIFHGTAYNLNRMRHPPADGIPANTNPLYDLPHKYGGQDGSFFFQNVNGACMGLITPAPGSDVPTDSDGSLAWYFPCVAFNQDGSSQPNLTIDHYLGYACHTTAPSRQAFYSPDILHSSGDVFFSWDDVRNTSRNLTVFSGAVLDLNLLDWFNSSQVSVPQSFHDLRNNPAVRGVDLTHAFSSGSQRQLGQCLSQIIKVGSIDTDTVGCIASEVVLYVSLVFILSIVLVKFLLALAFQWFVCRKFAAPKSTISKDPKRRAKEIEDWADDIYRRPPKLVEPGKRSSQLFPTTSRFTNPYNTDRSSKGRSVLGATTTTTMAASSTTALSRLADESRSSFLASDDSAVPTIVHDNAVSQPPPEWQPFGYPLVHTICLVTAYSEGAEGLRTTLDSIATTEYPNSHKAILVICDGMVKGHGESLTTPEIVLSMMRDHVILPDEVRAFSYVAVASGSKRHNMAKVYAGFYDYGERSPIARNRRQKVPMMVIVKCGTPDEASKSKPGNRGKRDSQVVLMSFLQKVMFDERMTELEYEMFNGLWKITGISPDYYETVLMVDADTKIFVDALTHMNHAMVRDPDIMGLCGETKIANKRASVTTMIQVFEYFISHHLSKSFESVFGGVTCLPGCFCMYRIKAPKGGNNYWVPILANPDVVEHYSENVVETLHEKNLLLLGEDRYLSTLMLRTFPKRSMVFVPQAVCKTTVPEQFRVLLSQRRRWINSTLHNLMELSLVRELPGVFCFSLQGLAVVELISSLVLPAAISFTVYLVIVSIVRRPVPVIPLVLLALILGLPAVLIVVTAHRWSYIVWMAIYLASLLVWNLVLPLYAFWKMDDFTWGETRRLDGAGEKTVKAGIEYEGEFDSTKITMKRYVDFESERRFRANGSQYARSSVYGGASTIAATPSGVWPPPMLPPIDYQQQHQHQQHQQQLVPPMPPPHKRSSRQVLD